jgi:hypothetical protein
MQANYTPQAMSAVFISFNQVHSEKVEYILDYLKIRGFTWWEEVKGRGSDTGDPRKGSHTWPEMNSALIRLLQVIENLDKTNEEVGIRAFVWNISRSY